MAYICHCLSSGFVGLSISRQPLANIDMGASSFRIDLAALSRRLCNRTRECRTQKSHLLLKGIKNKRLYKDVPYTF